MLLCVVGVQFDAVQKALFLVVQPLQSSDTMSLVVGQLLRKPLKLSIQEEPTAYKDDRPRSTAVCADPPEGRFVLRVNRKTRRIPFRPPLLPLGRPILAWDGANPKAERNSAKASRRAALYFYVEKRITDRSCSATRRDRLLGPLEFWPYRYSAA